MSLIISSILVLAVMLSTVLAFKINVFFSSLKIYTNGLQVSEVAHKNICRRGKIRLNVVPRGQVKGKAGCKLCAGTGGVDCVPCKGVGIDKKNGDMFQRFMCKKCFGFGKVSCSCTGGKGLTPEQTGER